MSKRVPYATAGTAMRQAIERALQLRPHPGERKWRVLVVVLGNTASYSKLEDRLYLAAVAADVFGTDKPTRLQIKKIGQDLSWWAARGVLERDPPRRGRPGSQGPRYRVALPAAVKGTADGSFNGAKRYRPRGTYLEGLTEKNEPARNS